MHSTHNYGQPVVAEMFIGTLKGKIYKTWQVMIGNLILVIWISWWTNTKTVTIIQLTKNPFTLIILLWLKKLRQTLNLLKLQLVIESELLGTKIFIAKITPKIGPNKYFLLILCLLRHIKLKIYMEKKIIGSFYDTWMLLIKLKMNFYPEPDNHTRDKVKVLLDWSNYTAKKIKQCNRRWYI